MSLRSDALRLWSRPAVRWTIALGVLVAVTLTYTVAAHSGHFFSLRRELLEYHRNLCRGLTTFSVFLGATCVAPDFSSGSLAARVTWEADRRIVVVARLCVAAVASSMLTLVALVLSTGAVFAAAALNSNVGRLDASWWLEVVASGLRGCVGAFAVGAVAASLAFLVKSTGMVMGVYVLTGFVQSVGVGQFLDPFGIATIVMTAQRRVHGHSYSIAHAWGWWFAGLVAWVLFASAGAVVRFDRMDVT